MLEVLAKVVCAIAISITISYINCQILNRKIKVVSINTIFLLVQQSVILCALYPIVELQLM